jgi:intein/homing endonuclease
MILTEQKIKKVEKIPIGENIYDRNNSFVEVNDKISRIFNGELIKIKALGILPFLVTAEHQILTSTWTTKMKTVKHKRADWKGLERGLICRRCHVKLSDKNWYHSSIKRKDYICIDCCKSSRKYIHELSELSWVEAQHLKESEDINANNIRRIHPCLVFPKYKKEEEQLINIKDKTHKLDEDLAGLFGLFYSEGGTYRDKRRENSGRITFTNNDESILAFITRVFKEKFNINLGSQTTHTTTLYKDDFKIVQFFEKHFDHKSWNKRIPQFIMDAPKNIVISFIKGLIDGDGTTIECGKSITTTSIGGALQIQKLLSKLDIFAGISIHHVENEFHEYNNRSIISRHDRYTIYIRGEQIENLNYKYEKESRRQYYEDESYFYLPIRKIERIPYNGLVWDVSTNGTFQVNNIILHNCDYAQVVHDGGRRGRTFVVGRPFLSMAIDMNEAYLQEVANKYLDRVTKDWGGS